MGDAYNNLGLCILHKASDYIESKGNLDYRSAAAKKAQQEYDNYLREALPYFTKLREIQPDAVEKWGLSLQNIYYQLKMDKQLDEVEARMKEKGII